MKNRLPRIAETAFAHYCNYGAICHRTDADENGWDYFVEFDDEPHVGAEDTRPPQRVAYVQVKSTTTQRLVAPVKISNMLKAARSHEPWFIFLFVSGANAGDEPTVYARHFWADLIEVGLRQARVAEAHSVKTNRRLYQVKFGQDDRVQRPQDIATWMKSTLDGVGKNYSEKKAEIYKTVGFEGVTGQGTITFTAPSIHELQENFLGLGKGLPVSRFAFTPIRFGISDKVPTVETNAGTIFIEPIPAGVCEISLSGKAKGPSLKLRGTIYPAGIPGPTSIKRMVRISSPPLEIVWKIGEDFQLKMRVEKINRYSFAYYEKYLRICRMMTSGEMKIEILQNGSEIFSGSAQGGNASFNNEIFEEIFNSIKKMVAGAGQDVFDFSINEVESSLIDLGYLTQTTAENALMRLVHPDTKDFRQKVKAIMYYSYAVVGGRVLGIAVKRETLKDEIVNGSRQLTLSTPQILQFFAEKSVNYPLEDLERDYLVLADREPSTVISFGNINEFIRSGG